MEAEAMLLIKKDGIRISYTVQGQGVPLLLIRGYAAAARHKQAIQGFDLCNQLQHGGADRLLPVSNAQQLRELIPRSELRIYEGLGHLFFMEDPEPYNRDVIEFIRKAEGRSAN